MDLLDQLRLEICESDIVYDYIEKKDNKLVISMVQTRFIEGNILNNFISKLFKKNRMEEEAEALKKRFRELKEQIDVFDKKDIIGGYTIDINFENTLDFKINLQESYQVVPFNTYVITTIEVFPKLTQKNKLILKKLKESQYKLDSLSKRWWDNLKEFEDNLDHFNGN